MIDKIKPKRMTSLQWKIYIGFGGMILLLISNGILGIYGLGNAMQSFDQYRDVEKTYNESLAIDRNVQELKRRVNQYINTGHSSNRDAVQVTYEKLQKQVSGLLSDVNDKEISESLIIMNSHLEGYFKNFTLATEERQLRTSLVQTSLPEQGQRVQVNLEKLEAQVHDSPQELSRHYLAALSAQRFFALAEKNALRYFAEPSTPFVDKTLSSLQDARSIIESIQAEALNSEKVLVNDLLSQLDEYEKICLRAFQATRSYLYLVNVVMSGEASEFAYYSMQIKNIAESKRTEINQATIVHTQDIKNITTIAIIGALLIGLYYAWRLAYSVVQPITAMTETFRRLGAGETLITIPATDRNDEIGEMATAADIFNKQNFVTKNLLQQSQTLSQELIQKTRELEMINSELDNFAYIASHDLKSPLRGIDQLAKWIQEDSAEELSEESCVNLNKLQGRIRTMETLLNDLLEYSRIGRITGECERTDTGAMLKEISELIDNPEKIQITIAPDMPVLNTFRTPLRHVFLNLITNAVKHHDHPETGKINIDYRELPDFYEFSVKDNGPGIDPKHHDRIFQMYQRVGNTTAEGSGMGLAIIKKQIETLGGTISVESAEKQNTIFHFTWSK